METNFSKSHEEMQLERINTVAEPKGWWHKEVEELKQQLAAALAAIKVKDAFIEKIAKQTPEKPDYWTPCGQCEYNTYDAEDLLAIQPDDSALKAWLGEPVAWRYESATGVYRYRGYVENFDTDYKLLKPIPLYAPKGMK